MNPLLKIVPPMWFFGFLGAGLLVHHFVAAARVFDVGNTAVGVALLIVGLAFAMYPSSLFAKEKTEILPTSETNRVLITYGPYRYTRNPMYLGMLVGLLGIAIWVGTLPLFVAVVLYFCLFNFAFIPFEEAKLQRVFGNQYSAYRSKVRRWL